MLIKEYRIPLPLSVEEYRIAQLYMISKKSRQESKGSGSGVEILINEPYDSGPGGKGQYTKKIYHVGNHLPNWFKSLLPKSALVVEEEAWNAYPYTKTRYTCPFIEKFFIEIETVYRNDCGTQTNIFGLTGSDLRNRQIDVMDIVKDSVGTVLLNDEDPRIFKSVKTGRGPLELNWLDAYTKQPKGSTETEIMCAYKLVRVEFRYWGMQTKLEKYIHDFALRKTMLRAHLDAWVWQDEWYGLTMSDIRQIERETQEMLRRKMAASDHSSSVDSVTENVSVSHNKERELSRTKGKSLATTLGSIEKPEHELESPSTSPQQRVVNVEALISPSVSNRDNESVVNEHHEWKTEVMEESDSDHNNDEEFFDCQENENALSNSIVKWSSLELLAEEENDAPTTLELTVKGGNNVTGNEKTENNTSPPLPSKICETSTLLLVFHAGSILDVNADVTAKKSDITTFRGCIENVLRQHYPNMAGSVAVKLVTCPCITAQSLSLLSNLSPYSFDVSPSHTETPHITHDSIPIGVIPVFSVISDRYINTVYDVINTANAVYANFLKSEEGLGFTGNVYLLGDSIGAVLAYDALCFSRQDQTKPDIKGEDETLKSGESVSPSLITKSSAHYTPQERRCALNFSVHSLFMFGSPLSLILAYRGVAKKSHDSHGFITSNTGVKQVYNLFHPTDPAASRLEPLIFTKFSLIPPVNIPRFQKYPVGNDLPYNLIDTLKINEQLFSENVPAVTSVGTSLCTSIQVRRMSEASICSNLSSLEPLPANIITSVCDRWWGSKRIDYALYCPEGLSNFPVNSLPHLFHASYWESTDVVAFLLRQIGGVHGACSCKNEPSVDPFTASQPCEKWIRKRTSVKLKKLKNICSNHRANDVIVKEGVAQTIIARFMYGSYDMITLTGEKVDIYVMNDGATSEWSYLATQLTDKTGRILYTIPEEKSFSYGIHHVKMIVRGDHTYVDFKLAVVPPKTECVVFSIDGSFTASVSVTGRDPKVRAGAVDVVRQWQELGYLIIYISARPDMQQQLVLSWLAQHNFPYGLVVFADRFSTDPLGYKTAYLKNLTQDQGVVICAAYGSNKDIGVYNAVGLRMSQIFIVGKVNKKYQSQVTALNEGYAAHLTTLLSHGGPRPAQGNARMVLFPHGYFGHNASIRRRSAKRTSSFPVGKTDK